MEYPVAQGVGTSEETDVIERLHRLERLVLHSKENPRSSDSQFPYNEEQAGQGLSTGNVQPDTDDFSRLPTFEFADVLLYMI